MLLATVVLYTWRNREGKDIILCSTDYIYYKVQRYYTSEKLEHFC